MSFVRSERLCMQCYFLYKFSVLKKTMADDYEIEANLVLVYSSLSAYAKRIVDQLIIKKENKKRRTRKTWQEKWLGRRDKGLGLLNVLREELLIEDPDQYKNFLRMDNECFLKLLNYIKCDIEKQNTHLRECVSAENR
ncbi:hypothetical protein ABEB36_012866 [Hypothenemus hampei]|uniref:Uncharacterized protein n=1 Tax=Hypothenemus hampei TaxID=57062 RepID=A0ABD1E6B6_HYPHA